MTKKQHLKIGQNTSFSVIKCKNIFSLWKERLRKGEKNISLKYFKTVVDQEIEKFKNYGIHSNLEKVGRPGF